jgi:hypothetical protein
MTIFDFIRDMQTGAPPERAGAWLRDNAGDMPELAAAIQSNLTAPPEVVVLAIAERWPLAKVWYYDERALQFIRELQAWLREHPTPLTRVG